MENTITKCLEVLLLNLNYAIERNIASIDIPLEGDVDILIPYPDYVRFLQRARERGVVISVARVYGGSRVYLEFAGKLIKRIDLIWRLHYRGINFLEVNKLLEQRVLSEKIGLYVLQEYEQACIVFYIKNAYGGAQKYQKLLEKHEFSVLLPAERRKLLSSFWRHNTRQTLVGVLSYWFSYFDRVFHPTGLALSGITIERARNIGVLGYLFQGKIREQSGYINIMFRSRFLSELCITQNKFAELKLGEHVADKDVEIAVITCLRSRATND